ncbi:Der GTPase-activating protein YihI [Alteromonas facilis]|uniref:Der GTPase-activating protein YihI n=1 Tax=Alteromonas facilis TaxID=2048004 RepID=UPI000C28A8DA|nr:Der GTPase-activating protein YihI [Alteromonas facilis]
MPRVKKSRKGGPIGVSKSPENRSTPQPRKPKRKKGKAPGSRHNVEQSTTQASVQNANTDKRLGSKKPVPLIVTKSPAVKPQAKKYATPRQELAALEANERFNLLLDQLENGDTLSQEEQAWLDKQLARHQVLCELLGIKVEEESEEDDPFAQLDAIRLDDFNDE